MEDPLIGTYRPSMKYNYLLERPNLGGQAHPFCRLPEKSFTYGRPNVYNDGGVKLAISDWLAPEYRTRRERIADFTKLNVDAIRDGHATTLEQKQFRDANVQKSKYDYNAYGHMKLTKLPDIAFGMPTTSQYGVHELISNSYYQEYMADLVDIEMAKRNKKEAVKKIRQPRKMDVVREALSHAQPQPEPILWKMKKFEKVGPKTSTWWDSRSTNVKPYPQNKTCACENIYSANMKTEVV